MLGKNGWMMCSSIIGSMVCSSPLPAKGPLLPADVHAFLDSCNSIGCLHGGKDRTRSRKG